MQKAKIALLKTPVIGRSARSSIHHLMFNKIDRALLGDARSDPIADTLGPNIDSLERDLDEFSCLIHPFFYNNAQDTPPQFPL